jgi:arginine exporter protein ArgO
VVRILLIAVGVSGLLALATNARVLWALHVAADLALLAFFGLWAWSRSVQADRDRKVEHIPPRRSSDLALRRAASS